MEGPAGLPSERLAVARRLGKPVNAMWTQLELE
jgi:hypothetical protein